jgi:hypothetical protein
VKPARLYAMIAGAAALLVLSAEVAYRVFAGDKLLYSAHPEIEYVPQPNQAVQQRGIDMRTNAWGMRSGQVSEQKPAEAYRLLVVGDSVVFGHTNIQHAALATTLLSDAELRDGRRLQALNVSASSWGPGNMLAWLELNGTFNSDTAILVLSTHDLEDNRTFGPLDNDFPQSRPLLGSLDWLMRRLPSPQHTLDHRTQGDAARALPPLLDRLAALPEGACLILHKTQEERQESGLPPQMREIAALAEARGIPVVEDFRFISVVEGFADSIHLSVRGQSQLAEAMKTCPALADRLPTSQFAGR